MVYDEKQDGVDVGDAKITDEKIMVLATPEMRSRIRLRSRASRTRYLELLP